MTTKKITTESELRHYLTKPYWDCLIVTETITLQEPVIITRPVRIMCANNAFISYFNLSTDKTNAAFIVRTVDVVFDSMDLWGLNASTIAEVQSGIIFEGGGAGQVVNSCISGFNYAGIWQLNADVIVSNSTIRGTGSGEGFNYGIWLGGSGEGRALYAVNNDFSQSRHAIGSHYARNSFYAIGNTVSTLKHSFDRHNSNDGSNRAGMHTVISGNRFLDTNRSAFGLERPYDGGSIVFTGNVLNHSSNRHIGQLGELGNVYQNDPRLWNEVSIHSNIFTS